MAGRDRRPKRARPALAFLVAVLVSAPAAIATPTPGSDEERAAAPEAIDDERIEVAIERELQLRPELDSNWIDLSSERGIVTLEGSVDHLLARDKVEELAEGIKGVRSVINLLDVRVPPRDDRAILADVDRALLRDPATDEWELGVSVDDGVVTLVGTVQSMAEKQLAVDVAKGVRGVREVESEIVLDYETDRLDHEIAADVRRSLEREPWIDDFGIEVAVEDGVVTLSGVVGSASERSLAAARAWVAGTHDVDTSKLEVRWWARDENRDRGPTEAPTDAEIRRAVEDTLLYDPRVFEADVTTTVDDGVVVLRGRVDSLQASRAAERDARNTDGVLWVRNHLKVRPEMQVPDRVIDRNVEEALESNVWTADAAITDIAVVNGRVHLYGTVDSQFVKTTASDVASDVAGAIEVVNHLEVRPAVALISDWRLQEEVEEQLWWSPFVDAEEVEVEVENGIVTLEGEVDTAVERRAAVDNAFDAGALGVINDLQVAGLDDDRRGYDWEWWSSAYDRPPF